MASDPFVPPDFVVPTGFVGPGFRLEPLGPEHNERDHEAWMSSIEHIRETPGFDDPGRRWPRGMSLEENLADLEMHARHCRERSGFTYSVLDGDAVIGCLYIYPDAVGDHDAEVRSWVTAARADMDVVVWRAVRSWLEEAWPFVSVLYAERT